MSTTLRVLGGGLDSNEPPPSAPPPTGREMFGLRPGRARRGVGTGLSFSLIAHGVVFVTFALLPLLTPEASPEPRAGNRVLLYNPPPPPPPPAGGSPALATAAPRHVAPPSQPTAFTAPVEEPTSVPPPATALDPSADAAGMPDGRPDGVPEGVPEGRERGVPNGTGHEPVLDFDRGPKLLKATRPRYPSEAFVKRVEGTVMLEILIDADGHVARARVTRSVPLLDEAAMATVREWLFAPAVKGGRPVPTLAVAPVTFMIH